MEERLVQKILRNSVVDPRDILHGWIVLIDNKIFISNKGKFIFETREKAVRALYSTLSWRARSCYAHFLNTGDTEEDYDYRNEAELIYPWQPVCSGAYKELKKALKKRLIIKQI